MIRVPDPQPRRDLQHASPDDVERFVAWADRRLAKLKPNSPMAAQFKQWIARAWNSQGENFYG